MHSAKPLAWHGAAAPGDPRSYHLNGRSLQSNTLFRCCNDSIFVNKNNELKAIILLNLLLVKHIARASAEAFAPKKKKVAEKASFARISPQGRPERSASGPSEGRAAARLRPPELHGMRRRRGGEGHPEGIPGPGRTRGGEESASPIRTGSPAAGSAGRWPAAAAGERRGSDLPVKSRDSRCQPVRRLSGRVGPGPLRRALRPCVRAGADHARIAHFRGGPFSPSRKKA